MAEIWEVIIRKHIQCAVKTYEIAIFDQLIGIINMLVTVPSLIYMPL